MPRSSQPFVIRDVEDQDAGSVAALISQLGYPTAESEMIDRLAALRRDPNYRTLVAQLGSTLVGVAGVGLAPFYERNGLYCRLLVLAVDSAQRGNGIGQALVRAAEAWAAARGATAMLVNSAHHRQDAHGFYESAGYKSTGVRFVKRLS